MASVTFDHVSKRFSGGTLAVKDFSLDVKDTEFMVLVGPSGCGKSTCLRMLAGLEEISDGEIRIGDRVVNEVPPRDRDIAMVFQSYALYPHMTVFDNLAFGLRMRGTPREDIERRVNTAAGILELGPLLKRKPRQLSGGQRQRVALGRAIVREPQAFLLDEPLSNLDAKLRVQTRIELQKQHRALHAVAGFIGSPTMNFIPVTIQGSKAKASGFEVELPTAPGVERAVLGVRPEAMTDSLRGAAAERASTNGQGTLDMKVEVTEILGADQFVYGIVGQDSAIARVDPQLKVDPGDRLRLQLDTRRLHLFDPASGEAIL